MSYEMKRGNKKVSFKELRTLPGIEKSPLHINKETDLPNFSGQKSDGVKANMFENKATQTSGPRANVKSVNKEEEKVITSMPPPKGDGGAKTDYFISNLHKDAEISLKKKKKESNEQDNKELDKHEDAMGY